MSTELLNAYNTEEFLSEANYQLVDDTVAEVFNMMLGLSPQIAPDAMWPPATTGTLRTAIVMYSGALQGSCEIRLYSEAACIIAAAMLGDTTPADDADDSVSDAAGEICNMISGGWKNRITTLSSHCTLSPPTIITGADYHMKIAMPSVKFTRIYTFDGQLLEVTMQAREAR